MSLADISNLYAALRICPFIAVLLIVGMVSAVALSGDTASGLNRLFVHVSDLDLGASTSRFDYQSFDPSTSRLYVSDMGSGRLLVIDTRAQRLVKSLNGFPKITGVLAVPALHRIYASVPGAGIAASLSVALGMAGLSSGVGQIATLDDVSYKEIARIPAGVFPDGIAYDGDDRKIFVSDELGSAVFVIDAITNKILVRIATGSQVGNVQYDPITKRVYVALQSRNELGVIDPRSNRLIENFALPGAEHPHGLRIADGAAIGYVACDENDRLLTIDLASGKVLASDAIARDPDVLAADTRLKRLYIAGESGILSVLDTTNPVTPRKLGEAFVGKDAHSVAVDSETHNVFLPLRNFDGRSVLQTLRPASD